MQPLKDGASVPKIILFPVKVGGLFPAFGFHGACSPVPTCLLLGWLEWVSVPCHENQTDKEMGVLRGYETWLRSLLGPVILYKINFSNIFCECRKDQRRHVGHASV